MMIRSTLIAFFFAALALGAGCRYDPVPQAIIDALPPEEGTPSADITPKVPSRVKRNRKAALMERQKAISLACNRKWVGRELDVLIESRSPLDGTTAIGRSFRDAAEIDGQVYVKRCAALPGTFVRTRVCDARAYDLIAEPIF